MKLYDYQMDILEKTADLKKVAYYLDMGLGKTFVGSEKMKQLKRPINFVVCQKSKVADWINHFKTYYPEFNVFNLTLERNISVFNECPELKVGIINYDLIYRRESIIWPFRKNCYCLMLDESSLIQNTKAKRTKFIMKLKPEYLILLSGTPVGGKYENLFSQMKLLGRSGTESAFLKKYVNFNTIMIGGFPHKIPNKICPYRDKYALKDELKHLGAVFMKTEEAIDLPEQIYIHEFVKKPKEYQPFMKDGYYRYADGFELIGDCALTKLLIARQICSIYCTAKLQRYQDLISSTNERIIVFYNFQEEYNKLTAATDKPYSTINGSLKDLANYETFENSVTFVQYQAGAMGLNLQKANRIIYFSLPLSSELFEQSKKRIHRIGQTKKCYYYFLLCEHTIENNILSTLKKRENYTNDLFIQEDRRNEGL